MMRRKIASVTAQHQKILVCVFLSIQRDLFFFCFLLTSKTVFVMHKSRPFLKLKERKIKCKIKSYKKPFLQVNIAGFFQLVEAEIAADYRELPDNCYLNYVSNCYKKPFWQNIAILGFFHLLEAEIAAD